MNVTTEEQLSALLDDELPEAEAALLLRRMARERELRATAVRYCVISDAVRGELPPGRRVDLVARVGAALGEEPPARTQRGGLGRAAAGAGIAAAVAVLALLALPGRQPAAPEFTASEVAAPAPGAAGLPVAPGYSRAAGGVDRLTRYYVNHTEYAPLMGGRGALTRIVATPAPAVTDAEETATGREPPAEEEAAK